MDIWFKAFSDNVKKYRIAKNLNKTALATLLDCDVSYIGKIERGEKYPNLKMIFKLAMALGVEPKDLFSLN